MIAMNIPDDILHDDAPIEPSKDSRRMNPTLSEAKRHHASMGYRCYGGPLLKGERTVIPFGSPHYPDALAAIRHPPESLYVIGSVDALCEGLAVVGARRATPYGLACAERFAGLAARAGIPIISGGALGCDAQAHRAALGEGAPTVAFLGGGCDCLYPARHQGLFQDIVDAGGAVVSEHEWDFPPLPYAFRERNRLIAGLARATLIVEAGLPSGTFSTADEALAANRDVLVVPGAITSKTSAGANRLLYQGATPIVDDETFSDVLFSLFGCLKLRTGDALEIDAGEGLGSVRPSCGSQFENVLLEALRAEPMRMDEMRRVVVIPAGAESTRWVASQLAQLEGKGLVCRYPDGRYGPTALLP